MKHFAFFVFPRLRKKVQSKLDSLNTDKFNLGLRLQAKERENKALLNDARMMSDYILTLEKRLQNYESKKTV